MIRAEIGRLSAPIGYLIDRLCYFYKQRANGCRSRFLTETEVVEKWSDCKYMKYAEKSANPPESPILTAYREYRLVYILIIDNNNNIDSNKR